MAGAKAMSIGINIHCYSKELPIHEQIKLMKENGFTTTFCMADAYDVDNIISTVQKEGIVFETLHAPLAGISQEMKCLRSFLSVCRNVVNLASLCW